MRRLLFYHFIPSEVTFLLCGCGQCCGWCGGRRLWQLAVLRCAMLQLAMASVGIGAIGLLRLCFVCIEAVGVGIVGSVSGKVVFVESIDLSLVLSALQHLVPSALKLLLSELSVLDLLGLEQLVWSGLHGNCWRWGIGFVGVGYVVKSAMGSVCLGWSVPSALQLLALQLWASQQ
jgi:hypothetical protein